MIRPPLDPVAGARARGPGRDAWNSALAWLALLCMLAVAVGYAPMINNGDWWRVCPSGHFSAMGWQALHASYPLIATGAAPNSTLALLVQLGLWLQLALGSQVYWTPLIFLALCGVFLGGCFMALANCRCAADRWIMASVILMGALYGFYFKSFYQEAATLALLPWFLGGMLALRDGRPAILFLSTCLLLASKIENVFFVPIALALFLVYGYPRKTLWVAATLLALAAILGFSFRVERDFSAPNAYNRYYSGVGWVSKGVATAPHRTFNGLRTYFYATLPKSLEDPKSIPPKGADLMGSSYWPTGWGFSEIAAAGSAADKSRFQDIMRHGQFGPFLGHFARHPGSIPGYLWAPLVVAARLNYDLNYLRVPALQPVDPLPFVARVDDFILGRLGYVYTALFAFALMVADWRRSVAGALVAGYFFIGAPIFCVLGDGYYEIEKHLSSLWFFAPVILHMGITDLERWPGVRPRA